MKLVTKNAVNILSSLIETSNRNKRTALKENRNYDYNYYNGRSNAFYEVRQWINNKQKGETNE